jgi:PIN domain nuclease of toxin-antitoxin system
MQLLLDTHALLWWALDSENLSKKARRALNDLNNDVYVSAASAWELATKFRIGKLPDAESFVHSFGDTLQRLGFLELPISVDHAKRAGLMSIEHKDPFDRMLIAQAQAGGFVLVSNEALFDAYNVHRLW